VTRRAIDPGAVGRGVAVGLAVIVPVSILVELFDRALDDFDDSPWLLVPFAAVLVAYFLAGRTAASRSRYAPVMHGIVAGLAAFTGWLAARVAIPAVQGDDIGFGPRAVLVNALLAGAFAAFGATTPARDRLTSPDGAQTPSPRD
jgi:hypothetical protein